MRANDGSTFFPVRALFEQAIRFWREVLEHHSGQSIVLVTHGGTARALICTAIGLTPEFFHSFQQSNCGLSILEFPAGSRTAQVEALNLTVHVGERMPKLKLGRRGIRIVLVESDQTEQQSAHISKAVDTEHPLKTVTLVRGRADFNSILSSILGLTRSPWKNCTNAVLHYPAPGKKPVIQAFNWPLRKEASEAAFVEASA